MFYHEIFTTKQVEKFFLAHSLDAFTAKKVPGENLPKKKRENEKFRINFLRCKFFFSFWQ